MAKSLKNRYDFDTLSVGTGAVLGVGYIYKAYLIDYNPKMKTYLSCLLCVWACLVSSVPNAIAQISQNNNTPSIRVIGGLATGNRFSKLEQPFWNQEIKQASNGKFIAEIIPYDQAGIPGQEMLRMMQLGVLPFATLQLSQIATKYPEFTAVDLAGYHSHIDSALALTQKLRPQLEDALAKRFGIKLLSIYAYPAQVLFCNYAFTQLSDLKGRRVRVASPMTADFIEALGAIPVITTFSEVMPNMRNKNFDCVVTGARSGNSIGLHQLTTHMHTMPLSFGISVLAANIQAWGRLPDDLKTLLLNRLPKLEHDIWQDARDDMALGIACNQGNAEICTAGKLGQMQIIRPNSNDEKLRVKIYKEAVLPKWIQRCGPTCAQMVPRLPS
ncbi:MAG: hypothetical protein RLZZ502_1528 [Pseudomonadota bacterium]